VVVMNLMHTQAEQLLTVAEIMNTLLLLLAVDVDPKLAETMVIRAQEVLVLPK